MNNDDTEIDLEVFHSGITPAEAEHRLAGTDDAIESARVRHELYYPYKVCTFRVNTRLLHQVDDESIRCGVDLINGKELIVDDELSSETKTVPENRILPIEDDVGAAKEDARTYVRDLVHQKLKPTRAPVIDLVAERLLYRLFYVLTIRTDDEGQLQYALDSVSGNFHRIYTTEKTPTVDED